MIGFKPNAFRGTFSVPMHLSRAFLWKFQLLIDVVEEMKWKRVAVSACRCFAGTGCSVTVFGRIFSCAQVNITCASGLCMLTHHTGGITGCRRVKKRGIELLAIHKIKLE